MEEDEEHVRRCRDFIHTLEEERRKIQAFHRELPLTMHIVSRAIDHGRQWLAVESLFLDGPEFEANSGEVWVEEAYIPESPTLDEEKSEDRADQEPRRADRLRSLDEYGLDVDINSSLLLTELIRSSPSVEKSRTGAFQPFHRDPASEPITASAGGTRGQKEEEKSEPPQKKPRRCWSSDLHHQFLDALRQLGGSSTATPKQIRELMKVDGLTNDEVKSHLQKYRLNTRRTPPPMRNSSDGNRPFFVVGNIWVPGINYEAAAAATATTWTQAEQETVYAPSAEIHRPVARRPAPPWVQSWDKPHEQNQSSPGGPLNSEEWASTGENPTQISPSVSSS